MTESPSSVSRLRRGLRRGLERGRRGLGRLAGSGSPSESDPGARLSSYPFVSGDGLAIACGSMVGSDPDGPSGPMWFVEASAFERPGAGDELLGRAGRSGARPVLVIHNGDLVPTEAFHLQALEVFTDVWSVNIAVESERIRALPIGLENFWWRGARELSDYIAGHFSLSPDPQVRLRRPTTIMGSFRVATNPSVRGDLDRRMGRWGIGNEELSRSDYRRRLLDAKFVLSPPGNGPDCHRTWEALCMGAVPVVLRGSLAPSLVRDTPILVVDDWDDVLSLSTGELDDLYVRQIAHPTTICHLDHWLGMIRPPTP